MKVIESLLWTVAFIGLSGIALGFSGWEVSDRWAAGAGAIGIVSIRAIRVFMDRREAKS